MANKIQPRQKCFVCGKEYLETKYYNTYSKFFSSFGKIPYCKQCIENLYQEYYETYKKENSKDCEKRAIRRLCMALDVYYSDSLYDSSKKSTKSRNNINISPFAAYMKIVQLYQHREKSYDTTIDEDKLKAFDMMIPVSVVADDDVVIDQNVKDFFGNGFTDDDYIFLKKEYDDWIARHECKTKAQEEVFKRLCFKQLEILKATRKGEDTKDLDATFQKLLDTAKLQPKQNSGDTTADNQTFGTLIDKWENTRPLPEIDEELKDVDKIALYINIFFKGHLAKMMGLKNGLSNLYTSFMKKYTVDKPEYDSDESNEALFDAVFGDSLLESDEGNKGVV